MMEILRELGRYAILTVWLRIVQIVVKLSWCICQDFERYGTSATAHWDYFFFYLTTEQDHMS